MRVLIVNIYGQKRSIGKITTLQYEFLKSKGYEVRVAYRGVQEPQIDNPDYIAVCGNIEPYLGHIAYKVSGYEGSVYPIATRRLMKLTEQFKPDVVQLNNLHGNFINSSDYIYFLNRHKIPAVYTMVDEYPYMGSCCYSYGCNQFMEGCTIKCPYNYRNLLFDKTKYVWEKKKKAYDGYENIVFTGPRWVVNRAKQSALLKNKRIVEIDEPISFHKYYYPKDREKLREKLGIPKNNIIIVTVTQMSSKPKGGRFFYEAAKILENRKDLTFVYVGLDCDEPCHVENLIAIPYVHSDEELADYFSLGDVLVSTSLADTQANTCLEAMGCGTPLIVFDAMGMPYIATEDTAVIVESQNVKALAEAFERVTKKNEKIIKTCRDYALGRYSPEVVMGKITSIYDTLLERKTL